MQNNTTLTGSTKIPTLFGDLTPNQQKNPQGSGWEQQGSGPITAQTPGLMSFGSMDSQQREKAMREWQGAMPMPTGAATIPQLSFQGEIKQAFTHDEDNDVDVTIVYGHAEQVCAYLGMKNEHTGEINLPNKEAIALGLLDDGRRYFGTGGQMFSWLAIAYVDGYHGNFKKVKKVIAKHLAIIAERMSTKTMSGTVKTFSVLHAFANGATYAYANVGIKKTQPVVNTLKAIWSTVFTQDGYVAGAKNKTRTIVLTAPESERIGFWGHNGNVEFVQSAFPGQKPRLAAFDDALVECLDGSQFKGITVEGIQNGLQTGTKLAYQDVQIQGLNGKKVAEFSKAIGDAVIATLEDGEIAFMPVTASAAGGKLTMSTIDQLAVKRTEETTAIGQIESADRDAIISRLRQGTLLTYKSTPTAQATETITKMVQALYDRRSGQKAQTTQASA